jgi:hypothetical protein
MPLQGVLQSGATYWTLPYTDKTIDFAVLAHSAFGADEGKVVPVATASNVAVADGDYTAGCAILGRGYSQIIDLGRLYLRGQRGQAILAGRVRLGEITVVHHDTGYYRVALTPSSTNTRTRRKEFDATGNDVEQVGQLQMFMGHFAERVTIEIVNDQPDPSTISAIEFDADYTPNTRLA